MAPKLSDSIDTLMTYLGWLGENTGMKKWVRGEYTFSHLTTELRLLRGICYCTEKFLWQELPSESFFNQLTDAINRNLWEIYPVCQEISKGLELDDTRCVTLFLIFRDAVETLKPLFRKAIDKYMYLSPSKHFTMEELLELIHLVSADGKEIHNGSSLKYLQLHKLDFLKDFISFAASCGGDGQDKLQDLLVHTRVVVITAAFCSYMLWKPGVMYQTIYSEYSEKLKVLPDIILKASRSSCSSMYTRMEDDDDTLGTFVDSLLKNHLELLASNCIFTVSVVKILTKEIRFLRNFLKDPRQEDVFLKRIYLLSEAGMLFYSLSLDDLKEDTELGLSSWIKEVQFLKQHVTKSHPETSRYKLLGTNELDSILMAPDVLDLTRELPDSTRKLSCLIDTLWSYLAWLEDFLRSTHEWDEFPPIKINLRLAQRIYSCLEMFFLQDLASESGDQSLKSYLDFLGVAINDKAWEIYYAIQEITEEAWESCSVFQEITKNFGLGEVNSRRISQIRVTICSSHFRHVLKILEPFLFGEVLYKCMHSIPSKNFTTKELLDLIQLVLEDGKEIHSKGSLKSLQLHKLEFLKSFVVFADSRGVEQDKLQDLMTHIGVVVTTATYCSYVLWRDNVVDENEMSSIYSQYSEMLKVQPNIRESYVSVLKALGSSCSPNDTKMDDKIVGTFIDSLLENHWELLASKSCVTVSVMKILIQEHRFLTNFLIYKRQEGVDLDEKTTNLIFDVVSGVGIVSYFLSWENTKEVLTRDTKHRISNWMKMVQLLKEDVGKKYPETSRYNFPRTDELGYMDGLMEDLKELIRHKPDSIAFAHEQLEVALNDLDFLKNLLQNMVKQRHEHEELKALWFHVVNVAYRFEFIINSLVVGDPSPDCSPTSFDTIKEEIKKIRIEAEEISVEKRSQIGASNTPKITNHLPSRISNPTMDEVIVGFEDEVKNTTGLLGSNSAKLEIVLIVGMPGLGKTTLAKMVYNKINSCFNVSAWCCVSQGFQKRKLLLDMLSGILLGLPTEVDQKSDEDLEALLKKSLKGKRYLIVLDDIWDIEAWRSLQLSFPDDNNRSRILITSRIHIKELQAKPHFLSQLNDDKSRDLLEKKLFQDKDCPAELQDVVMQIAKSCKGLPFAVVTVAGILATLELDGWEDFANGLSTALVSGTELLELSYIHLPDYLKSCLLYFGLFLQDEEIPVSRLIWLWKAEGFVQKTIGAEDNLKDLINRSLVKVVKQTSRGGIKACSVHDLVHQFCVTRAREENFLHLLNHWEKIGPLSEPRRMCIYSWEGVPCFRHLRSLKLFGPSYYSEVSTILCSFKILKVLDLSLISCSCFPAEVEMLVHLRFLALAGHITSIPSTIVKLWNLETFLLRGLSGGILLPYTLLNMTKLRHMHVKGWVDFSLPEHDVEKCCESSNLETFSTLLSSGQDMMMIFRKIRNLRKLKCTQDINYQFPAFNFLSQLESLKVYSSGKVPYQLEFSFPLNLKKLTLSNVRLPWASISRFAQLPNLLVLKLLNKACEGETWDMEEEDVFRNLQYLKFENLDIEYWIACKNNFPHLQQLILHKCKKLQGIHCDIVEFDCIKIVDVKYCHSSVATWAQNLEQMEGLKVSIDVAE